MTRHALLLAALLSCSALILPTWAQDDKPAPSAAPKPAETKAADQPSAEDVLNQLLKKRAENPLIEPAAPAPGKAVVPVKSGTAPKVKAAVAPGAPGGQLRREGQFIVTRRGRLLRSATTPGAAASAVNNTPWIFAFESDTNGLADAPMYLMPCQMLEDMEEIAEQHGDSLVFVLSGQVFVYRGANYLLPTLMKLAPQKGNLQP